MSGRIYIFSGPSGAGKSTIIRELRKRLDNLSYSVSHTSRAPRKNEKDGKDYHFVDKGTFKIMIDDGAFVEWAKVYNDLYGTTYSSLNDQVDKGIDIILDVDSQGAVNIRDRFPESIMIFILPPSLEVLQKRLRTRATDSDDTIESRIRQAGDELRKCDHYDYLIINDELDRAVKEAEAVIISDRRRKDRVLSDVKRRFGI